MNKNNNNPKKVSNPYAKRPTTTNVTATTNNSNSSRKRSVEEISTSSRNAATNQITASHSVRTTHENETNSNNPLLASNTNNTTNQTATAAELIQPHVLLVSTKQRGNGVLRFIRNVPYTYTNIVPDYIMGPNRCALFLSFKYHNLHPNYIHRRIAELKGDYDLRVLLCLVDVQDNASILLHLNNICVVNQLSLTLAWSEEECARYLETFKAFEGKDASLIQKKKEVTYMDQVCDVLGCVRSVNKTDSSQLLMQFGNMKNLATSKMEDLRSCPGIGEKKVRRLFDAFHKPFSTSLAEKRREERERLEMLQVIERDIANIEEEDDVDDDDDDDDDDNNGSENKNDNSDDSNNDLDDKEDIKKPNNDDSDKKESPNKKT